MMIFFVPPLETPIKTLDLPVAGRGYSADSLKLILDVVEFVNKPTRIVTPVPKSRQKRTQTFCRLRWPWMEMDRRLLNS